MNEFEERRGQSPFYAIMAILTLVVAAVGATFAYFSLVASNNSVQGTVAKVGLSMSVTPYSTGATGSLIPLISGDLATTEDVVEESLLPQAVAGDSATGNKVCVDKNGNTVCKIYEITVYNEGNTTVEVDGNIKFTAVQDEDIQTKLTNLKWQIMTDAATPSDAKNDITFSQNVANATLVEKAEIAATPVGTTLLEDKSSVTYYLMIWLDDTGSIQNDYDYGEFLGEITFTSGDASGITGSFTVAG